MNEISKYYSIPILIHLTLGKVLLENVLNYRKIINNPNEEETNERLKLGQPVGHDRQYGEYALAGAMARYGVWSRGSRFLPINDFNWLKEKFNGNA